MSVFFLILLTFILTALASSEFQSNFTSRIIGGRPAKQGEVPYQLTLKLIGRHNCGASLIEVNGIQLGIGAAHCVYNVPANYYSLTAGDINLADKTGFEQTRRVVKIVKHPKYESFSAGNDIALFFLNRPYKLNKFIQPISMPKPYQETQSGWLTTSGWGEMEHGDGGAVKLQIVELPVIDDRTCQDLVVPNGFVIKESMLCAHGGSGGSWLATCRGDSGGPAIGRNDKDEEYLAGIVSFVACK